MMAQQVSAGGPCDPTKTQALQKCFTKRRSKRSAEIQRGTFVKNPNDTCSSSECRPQTFRIGAVVGQFGSVSLESTLLSGEP
mmetsp:Transcript_50546/g.134459  ORF Transcript_50546/g.134459 Transcript_50546/m.134459 type:complete len:82 (-) Transcript_50546:160-405(-)